MTQLFEIIMAVSVFMTLIGPAQSYAYSLTLQTSADSSNSRTTVQDYYLSGPQTTGSVSHTSSISQGVAGDSASAQATGLVQPGHFGAFVTGTVDNSFGPYQYLYNGNAHATVFATWNDTLTFTSSTLANGTPVDLDLTMMLSGSFSPLVTGTDIANSRAYMHGYFGGDNIFLLMGDPVQNSTSCSNPAITVTACGPGNAGSVSAHMMLHGLIGSSMDFSVQFEASTMASLVGYDPITNTNSYYPFMSNTLDFLHTGLINLDTVTPGVSYTLASGADLRTPVSGVPEPNTILLLSSGLAGLAIWRRKQSLVA